MNVLLLFFSWQCSLLGSDKCWKVDFDINICVTGNSKQEWSSNFDYLQCARHANLFKEDGKIFLLKTWSPSRARTEGIQTDEPLEDRTFFLWKTTILRVEDNLSFSWKTRKSFLGRKWGLLRVDQKTSSWSFYTRKEGIFYGWGKRLLMKASLLLEDQNIFLNELRSSSLRNPGGRLIDFLTSSYKRPEILPTDH